MDFGELRLKGWSNLKWLRIRSIVWIHQRGDENMGSTEVGEIS